MLISCNLLKKHIKNSEDIDFLNLWEEKFTIRTAEVEGVYVKGNQFDGVITAKIVDCQNHPDSKKLHILKVDTGKDIVQIVCGAPNVHVGLIGAMIPVGGRIEDITIGVRPLAGVDSYGMMCSGKELGISDDHSGIIELPSDTTLGVNIKELFPIDDIIVEIDNKSLTHRPDLWGHYGIAREVASITSHELLPLELYDDSDNKELLDIKINNPELCYRYVGTKINNIKNNVTPMWMQIFLYYTGMRSIDLLVDLTNYVMLELGTPMHAFDSRVVKNIEVGLANNGEEFTTLDGTKRMLSNEDLMIKNGGEYFAVAGVMGGLDSEIREDTDSIVLESATFEPSTVRKTAIRLGLRTEASARYEKSLDPNMALTAAKRFIKLLNDENKDMAFGSAITDIYPTKQNEIEIDLKKDLLYKYMGFEISDEFVINILSSLDFKVTNKKDLFHVIVPTYRATKDITLPVDLIEEISRMYGYENFDHIPLKMNLEFSSKENTYEEEYEVKNYLASKYDLHEVNTYLWNKTSFLKKLNIELDNVKLLGKSEDNTLRRDLALSLLETALVNSNNYDEYGIYEIGTTINEDNQRKLDVLLCVNNDNLKSGYYNAKKIVVSLFRDLKNLSVSFKEDNDNNYYNNDLTQNIIIGDKVLGSIKVFNREVSNKINKKKSYIVIDIDFDLYSSLGVNEVLFKDISKYPTTNLDYTVLTKRGEYYDSFENILNEFTSPIIINRELIDIYIDGDIKKITIRYIVGSNEKTLTNEELQNFKDEFIKFLSKHELSITEE